MKKIFTYFNLLFYYILFGQGQNCVQEFNKSGSDLGPTVLSINASDLTCGAGIINSIKITSAYMDDYGSSFEGQSKCGIDYGFILNIDGEVSSVCKSDLINKEITNFQTLSITTTDLNNEDDFIIINLKITTNYTLSNPPFCTTVTGPTTNEDSALLGIIKWDAVSGSLGYKITVGTAPGGNDVLNNRQVGNVTSYDIPGLLLPGTEYLVKVVPYNSVGNAEACETFTFVTPMADEGDNCQNAHVITQLPFTVTGNTQDNLDSLYEGLPGANGCGAKNYYLNGNDVVYMYTAENTGSLTINLSPSGNYAGLFIYDSCNNIGVNCLAGKVNNDASNALIIENFRVTHGITYYILISNNAPPQTMEYNLQVTENTCTDASVTYTTEVKCQEDNAEFFVKVKITDLGSATSLTLFDNQQSEYQYVSQLSTVNFGPYILGANVIISVTDDQDASCEIVSDELTVTHCPPNCQEAIEITACNEQQTANFIAGTGYWNTENDCDYSAKGVELLYSFTPEITGLYKLTVLSATGDYVDYQYKIASNSCNEGGWKCIDDIGTMQTANIGVLTAGVKYLFLLDNEGITANSQVFKIDCISCSNPTVNYTTTTNCQDDDQSFLINVNVTDMGAAESLSITDNETGNTQQATATGIYTFGPYLLETNVIITTSNDLDYSCTLTSNQITVHQCPPANDECVNATELIVGNSFAQNAITASNIAATKNSTDHNPESILFGCNSSRFNTNGKDVWFTATIPASGKLTIETNKADEDILDDTALFVYTGSCTEMQYLKCSGDDGEGVYSKVELLNLNPGDKIFAKVFGKDGRAGKFKIAVYDLNLKTETFEKNQWSIYPNPVKDVLNISYFKNITNVEVYNLLGQKMLQKTINESSGVLNMESLATGAYVVKIYAEGQAQSIKVMKQ